MPEQASPVNRVKDGKLDAVKRQTDGQVLFVNVGAAGQTTGGITAASDQTIQQTTKDRIFYAKAIVKVSGLGTKIGKALFSINGSNVGSSTGSGTTTLTASTTNITTAPTLTAKGTCTAGTGTLHATFKKNDVMGLP